MRRRGVGQPVPAGHIPDQVCRVGGRHSGRGDEQRACRGSVRDRHGVGRGAERGFGHPDHRDAELGVRAPGAGRRSRMWSGLGHSVWIAYVLRSGRWALRSSAVPAARHDFTGGRVVLC
jgi:hypothetical protein